MEQKVLLDALVQAKRMGNLLNEVLDLSQQLSEALNRDDQVAVQLILGMREEPVASLRLADQALRDQRDAIGDPRGRAEFTALLNGRETEDPGGAALAQRMAINQRLLDRVQEVEQVLSEKLSRGKGNA